MNKLLGVAVVGAAIVGVMVIAKGAGAGPLATPEGRACVKVRDLCQVDDASKKDLSSCEEDLVKARKLAGPSGVDRSLKCIDTAQSCVAVSGCLMGGIGVGAAGEMMKGFGTALSQ